MAGFPGRGSTPIQSSATDIVVREGFICPICMQDLGTIHELQDHFERDHAGEDKSILQHLKGLLMRKVGFPGASLHRNHSSASSEDESSAGQLVFWDTQGFGQFQDHTDYFKKIRDSRTERFMVETNKLVIRLDRLAHEAPVDPRQRLVGICGSELASLSSGKWFDDVIKLGIRIEASKYQHSNAFEKHLASWVLDQDVPVCPGCGKSFKIFVRKHHCRLCGSVICADCNTLLEPDFVEKLTNPVGATLRAPLVPRTAVQQNGGPIMRSNSSESLMSVIASMTSKDKEHLIRVCGVCNSLLERRSKQMDEKHTRTELEELHERMAYAISDAEKIYPGYQEMALSLQAGETNFQLVQATELRNQLSKLFDMIDSISKKIGALPVSTSSKEEKLRANVRVNAVEYLKCRVLAMSALPTAEQCEQLQHQRREEVKRRILASKAAEESRKAQINSSNRDSAKQVSKLKAALISKNKNPFEDTTNPFESDSENESGLNPFNEPGDREHVASNSNGGWASEPVRPEDVDADDDPLLQQIDIVKRTINQARQAGRKEEAASLSQHLEELNKFYRQKVVQNL